MPRGFSFAKRVRGQVLPFHFVRLFVAPRAESGRSGCASSAALRPTIACDRVVPIAARTLVVRPSAAHVSTQRSARSGPARSGAMAPVARGADFTPTSLSNGALGRSWHRTVRPGFNVSSRRVGVSNRQAGASGHVSRGRGDPARGPGRGVGDPAKRETPRGPGTERAAGSRSRESRRAASGGEQATRGRAPAWQNKSRLAVTTRETAPSPWGKRRPPRGGRQSRVAPSHPRYRQNKSRHAVKTLEVLRIDARSRGLPQEESVRRGGSGSPAASRRASSWSIDQSSRAARSRASSVPSLRIT